jgi:hypothetical protein
VDNPAVWALQAFLFLVNFWALVNVVRRPSRAFEDAGKSRVLWLILILVGIFACNAGIFLSLAYLFMVDPQVKRMQHEPGRIGFPGGR